MLWHPHIVLRKLKDKRLFCDLPLPEFVALQKAILQHYEVSQLNAVLAQVLLNPLFVGQDLWRDHVRPQKDVGTGIAGWACKHFACCR